MGRQINYYIDRKVENQFIKFVFENGFSILEEDLKNERINIYKDYLTFKTSQNKFFLYKKSYGDIKDINNFKFKIDFIISPVIEFTRTVVIENEKKIVRGRLWYEPKYFLENGELYSKDQSILKDFSMLVRWLKKNVLYTEIIEGGYPIKEYITDEIKKLVEEENYKLI